MTLESLCESLRLSIDGTGQGYRLLSRSGHAVTVNHRDMDELRDDAAANGEDIRIASLVVAPGPAFERRHIKNLGAARREIEQLTETVPAVIERLRSMVSCAPEGQTGLPFELLELTERIMSNVPRHRAVLDESERMVRECPSRMALPLGAVVRLKNDYEYPEYCALDPRRFDSFRKLPAAGSVAFVVGNGFGQDERGVVIVFVDPFADVNEERSAYQPSPSVGYAVCVRPEDVELVSLAETFDGSTCLDTEIAPSHRAAYDDGLPPARVLALRSGGRILVLQTGRYADPLDRGTMFYDEGGLDFELLPLASRVADVAL
jgi:hypothetical protein